MLHFNSLEVLFSALNSLSRGAPSTTRPPLQLPFNKDSSGLCNPLNYTIKHFFVEQCVNMRLLVGENWGRNGGFVSATFFIPRNPHMWITERFTTRIMLIVK